MCFLFTCSIPIVSHLRLFIALFSSYRIIDPPKEPVIVICPEKKRNTPHYNFQVPIVFTLEPCLTKLEAEITLSPVTREDKQQGWKKNGEKWKPGKGKIILLRMVRILKMENEFWEQKSLLTKTISGLGVKRVGSTIFDNASYRTPVWHFCPFGLYPVVNHVCLKWILHLVPSKRIFVTVLICRS